MELSEIVLTGSNEAWIRFKGDVEILIRYVSPEVDRTMRGKIMKQQFRGHQRMEPELDEIALRDYYCTQIVRGFRGLTKDGEPFEPTVNDIKGMWDGSHEFGLFVIDASRKMENFLQEKKA